MGATRWIRSSAREIFGLFVDDGSFAIAILIWLAVALVVLPRLGVAGDVKGPVLVIGLLAIIAESALRRVRR